MRYDAREALALAPQLRPQVAILDIGMPGMTGYQLAERLRTEPWAAGMLLVAATGWGQPQDVRRAREAGFDLHLTKPLDPERIVTIVAETAPAP